MTDTDTGTDIDLIELPGAAVLDSNAWVFAITGRRDYAMLPQLLLQNNVPIHVNAYIFDEVFVAFDRSLAGSEVEETKQRFAEFVAKHDGVYGPTQDALRNMDLGRVRSSPTVEMLSRVLGVQAKDVPILVLAWQVRDDSPTIFTEDKPFAEFDPAAHDLPEMEIGRARLRK